MIVLHQHKLIFLKARKVAGTSFEIALSKYADKDDIVTPVSEPDEEIRRSLGFQGPANYEKALLDAATHPSFRDIKRLFRGQTLPKFYNHMPAHEVKSLLGEQTWNAYTKVSIVRNPFDYVVSVYFWENKGQRPDFEKWCLEHQHIFGRNNEHYLVANQPVIDHFIRYEALEADIRKLEELKPGLAGLFDTFQSIKAKGGIRPKKGTTAQEMFEGAEKAKQLVNERSRYEIEKFGYGLEVPAAE